MTDCYSVYRHIVRTSEYTAHTILIDSLSHNIYQLELL